MTWRNFWTISLGITLAGSYSMAEDSHGNSHKNSKVQLSHEHQHVEETVSLIFSGINADDARALAKQHQMEKSKPLPPGIRKNLARGKPLPSGIAKQTLPQSMLNALPHYDGYEWQQQGADLILVSEVSGIITDILFDVFD